MANKILIGRLKGILAKKRKGRFDGTELNEAEDEIAEVDGLNQQKPFMNRVFGRAKWRKKPKRRELQDEDTMNKRTIASFQDQSSAFRSSLGGMKTSWGVPGFPSGSKLGKPKKPKR